MTFPRSHILSFVREADENVCQGDDREEGYIIIVRAVVTTDFMTASAYHFDWDFRKVVASVSHTHRTDFGLVDRLSTRIVNEVDGVTCVTYNVTSKPPATIEMQ